MDGIIHACLIEPVFIVPVDNVKVSYHGDALQEEDYYQCKHDNFQQYSVQPSCAIIISR